MPRVVLAPCGINPGQDTGRVRPWQPFGVPFGEETARHLATRHEPFREWRVGRYGRARRNASERSVGCSRLSAACHDRSAVMQYSVNLVCETSTFQLRLSALDARLFSVIEKRVLPKVGSLLQRLIWWADDDRPGEVARDDLLKEVSSVLHEMERDIVALSYAYSHECCFLTEHGERFEVTGPGKTSGHRMKGDEEHFYSIDTGLGVCTLEKWALDESGGECPKEIQDCRQLTKIETENSGTVILTKRRIKTKVLFTFRQFHDWLLACHAPVLGVR